MIANSDNEIWKPLEGFTLYEVSSFGNFRSIDRDRKLMGTGLLINPEMTPYFSGKFLQINLRINNMINMYPVHRLVANAFCEKPENTYIVDHIDRNRENNNCSNLRWTTRSGSSKNRQINIDCGVNFQAKSNCWIASWKDIDSKTKSKSFSVLKSGAVQAKKQAVAYRKKMCEENGYLNV